jgi:hypothetical protein
MVYNSVFENPLDTLTDKETENNTILPVTGEDSGHDLSHVDSSPAEKKRNSKDLFGNQVSHTPVRSSENPALQETQEPERTEPRFIKDILVEEEPVLIEGLISQRDENDTKKIVAENITPLSKVREKFSEELHLHVYEGTTTGSDFNRIKELCRRNSGHTKIIICVSCSSGEIAFIEASPENNIKVTESLLAEIKNILGERKYKIKADKSVPEPRRRFQPRNNEMNGNFQPAGLQ